jgi:hypothetical protein
MKNKNKKPAFGILELLLAGSVFILLLVSTIGLLLYSRSYLKENSMYLEALSLADEGMTATSIIRDRNFSNLADGSHGLLFFNEEWIFQGNYDEKGVFKREIFISTVEDGLKEVTVDISWDYGGNKNKKISLSGYFSQWAEKEIEIEP